MNSLNPREWTGSLLRAVSPSRLSLPPATPPEAQQDKENSAKEKSARVARNAALAGVFGAGVGALKALKKRESWDEIARNALTTGAASAATVAAITDSEGSSMLTRAAAGLGAGTVAYMAAKKVTKMAKGSRSPASQPYDFNDGEELMPNSQWHRPAYRLKFGAGEVNRPYV